VQRGALRENVFVCLGDAGTDALKEHKPSAASIRDGRANGKAGPGTIGTLLRAAGVVVVTGRAKHHVSDPRIAESALRLRSAAKHGRGRSSG